MKKESQIVFDHEESDIRGITLLDEVEALIQAEFDEKEN